ncbi:Sodium/hydrogen exchanger [Aphelenchoides bicaudatus]|nr:Sodium/hydrogen exchanger [Aphelenchoides bicaudatus]
MPKINKWTAYLALLVAFLFARSIYASNSGHSEEVSADIIGLNWKHVESPYLVSLWLIIASFAKIGFHANKRINSALPDSALLIAVGLVLGFGLKLIGVLHHVFYLPSEVFFLFLLPPIIFDAGYFMPIQNLFDNFWSIMIFSVIGTIWNTLTIGIILAVFGYYDFYTVHVKPEEAFLFASLISAVDPVAVITVFEEIHVNEFLFIIVFGEALFNDGIAAVLFQIFKRVTLIGAPNLSALHIFKFSWSFFAVALGGALIGVLFAIIAALSTKYTERVRIVGPLFVFVFPYLSYLTAELFGLSAILAICCCGIAMKQYVKGNITEEAASSVKYFVKMLAQSSETAVFMFLGLSTATSNLHWDLWFIGITLVACLLCRASGVFIQCFVLNFFRAKKFTFRDQFIMAYGGLRGAIAFGLLSSVPDSVAGKSIFTTATIVVIFSTVFIQGTTIKPLLTLLKVETCEETQKSMAECVLAKYFDYTMAGIEDILAHHGEYRAKMLKPMLMRDTKKCDYDASEIVRAYHKIAIQDALKKVNERERRKSEYNVSLRLARTLSSDGTTSPQLPKEDDRISKYIDDEMQTQRTAAAAQEKPLETPVKIEEEPTEEDEFFNFVNDLLDLRMADFKKEPVEGLSDIKDDYGPPAAVASRRQSKAVSLGSGTERRHFRRGLSRAETLKSPLLTRIDSI